MANTGRLAHNPNMANQIAGLVVWSFVAENVGHGGGTLTSVNSVFYLFMNSPTHRANILSNQVNRIAVGCVRAGNGLWITQNFWG